MMAVLMVLAFSANTSLADFLASAAGLPWMAVPPELGLPRKAPVYAMGSGFRRGQIRASIGNFPDTLCRPTGASWVQRRAPEARDGDVRECPHVSPDTTRRCSEHDRSPVVPAAESRPAAWE
jgi:hypothetical protein